MKNKAKFTFLTLVLTAGLIATACGKNNPEQSQSSIPGGDSSSIERTSSSQQGAASSSQQAASSQQDTSSKQQGTSSAQQSSSQQGASSSQQAASSSQQGGTSSSSQQVISTYTVTFVVDGQTVQTSQVEAGELAVYNGSTPTKAQSGSTAYRFKGWDKDLTQPITANTVFTAVFEETVYAEEIVIDSFETYRSSSGMKEAGWKALGYSNATSTWTTETNATVSLGTNAAAGNKGLRFDAWENGTGYKFAKDFADGTFTQSANALRFNLMVPSINTVRILLYAKANIPGVGETTAWFRYQIKPTTGSYVEYTIPIADANWQMYGEAGKTFPVVADYIGIHQDDIVKHLTKIEYYIEGNDGIGGQNYTAFFDELKFVTTNISQMNAVETMGSYSRYTGLLSDGHTVKIELGANGAAVATVLDMETPMVINGTYAVDDAKNMTFTSQDNGATLFYKGKLVNGGQQVKFDSATGALAQGAEDMDLNAVQVVDNFEQYTEDGTSYHAGDNPTTKEQRSGCRGAYYSEYYSGGGSSEWGGNGWNLIGGDGSQLKLKNDSGAHSGSKYLCVKHSKSFGFRYMQWGLFDGSADKQAFRGSKLGFWAKTNGLVKSFKVSMYSNYAPTNATRDERVRSTTVELTANSPEWKHYEVDLNPNLVYYGYMIFTEKNTSLSANESWLYFDDVEVYSANPYAKYEAPVQPVVQDSLENGQVFCGRMMGIASAMITIGKDNSAHFSFAGTTSMSVDGTYSANGNRVTFDFGSSAGQLVVDVNDTFDKLTVVEGTSGFSHYFTAGMLFNEMDVLDNAETYTESGKMYYQNMTDKKARSGARGAYYCDYYSGGSGSDIGGSGWSLMGGSGDQLSLETNADNVHSGNNSLKLKRNKTNTMRYSTWGLHDGSAEGHTGANYFMYYAKNPNNDPLTIKTSVYYQAQVTPATQQSNRDYLEAVIPAKSDWVPVVIPLDPAKTYYGVAYTAATVSGGSGADYFYIDDAIFYSEEMNIGSAYGVCKDLTLAGTIAGGAAEASITFGDSNNAVIACSTLGLSLNVKFTLIDGVLKIKVPAIQGGSGSEIVGNYGPSAEEFVMSLTITSVTGDLATYIAADSVFQGRIPNM